MSHAVNAMSINPLYFINAIIEFFLALFGVSGRSAVRFFDTHLGVIKAAAFVLVIAFLAGIIYVGFQLNAVFQKKRTVRIFDFLSSVPPTKRLRRWQVVLEKVESMNASDWKLAVIEADNIVDDIVKRIGYHGTSFGERLLQIEPSDFDNLQNVWEAHKIRNRIAHEAGYALSQNEARQAITLFEKALKELKYLS